MQIVEFVDFKCPYCTLFAQSLDSLFAMYPGEIHVSIRNFPLSVHRHAQIAARAAECSVEHKAFSAFHEHAYDFPDSVWSSAEEIAGEIGVLDRPGFLSCVESDWAAQQVVRDSLDGVKAGIAGTPLVIINGWRFPGTPSLDDMLRLIERERLLAR